MKSGPIGQDAAASGTDDKKSVALTVAPAAVLYGQEQSIPVVFGGKTHGRSGHEKTLGIAKETKGF